MKQLLVVLFISSLIFSMGCNQPKNNDENNEEKESANQTENTVRAVYFEHADLYNLSFIFYFENNGYLSPLIIKDNGEKELEELRNPQNYNKCYEIKTTVISTQFEEIEQHFADSILSLVQLTENKELISKVNKEIYFQYINDMDEMELPIAINKESFDVFNSQAISIPDKFFWLFTNTQNKFIDVRQEYGYTDGKKYQPETAISMNGKIPTDGNQFDLF